MWNPSTFFISNRFHGTKHNFGPLNDHMIKRFSWVVTMVTDHAQHFYLEVTSPVTVATTKRIVIAVIADYMPYEIPQNQFSGLSNTI